MPHQVKKHRQHQYRVETGETSTTSLPQRRPARRFEFTQLTAIFPNDNFAETAIRGSSIMNDVCWIVRMHRSGMPWRDDFQRRQSSRS